MENHAKTPGHTKLGLEPHIDHSTYTAYAADLRYANLHNLRAAGFVGTLVGLALLLLTLPPFGVLGMTAAYLTLTLVCAAIYLLCRFVLPHRMAWVLPVYYLLIVLLLGLAVLMGTVWGLTSNATTFLLLMVLLPQFLIDEPWRLNLVTGVLCVAFCLTVYWVKPHELHNLDITNCLVFYFISMFSCRQMIRTKMSDIIIKSELKRQRDVDMLTDLNNRGALERIVADYIHESNQDAVMLILDIDNFKSVNDRLGHGSGDKVLQLVGEAMKSTFRPGDIVSRLGGDEFVAFLPAALSLEAITARADALIAKVCAIRLNPDEPLGISASIGLAKYPKDGCTFSELYKQADTALYCAKRRGKGQWAIYQEDGAGKRA